MSTAWDTMLRRQLEYADAPLTRHRLLMAHLDYAWDLVGPRLDGLTDEEYLWEPVPEGWSVRPQPDGTFMADWAFPEPEPAPFTNIAWRLAHIGFFLNLRSNHLFGDGTLSAMNAPWPGHADDGIAWADAGFADYRKGIAELADEDLDRRPAAPAGTLDTQFPTAMGVQHITLELIHHGAELALLRDLYRVREG